ncbi:MAG: methyl-accepting chemotaxis protein [Symbiopectobacterium sp.]
MGDINDNSRKIADISSIINSIAFQINILALNAAAEAARPRRRAGARLCRGRQ